MVAPCGAPAVHTCTLTCWSLFTFFAVVESRDACRRHSQNAVCHCIPPLPITTVCMCVCVCACPGDRAEGAEGELENVLNNNPNGGGGGGGGKKAGGLESHLSQLTLQRAKANDRDRYSLAQLPTPAVLLLNSV